MRVKQYLYSFKMILVMGLASVGAQAANIVILKDGTRYKCPLETQMECWSGTCRCRTSENKVFQAEITRPGSKSSDEKVHFSGGGEAQGASKQPLQPVCRRQSAQSKDYVYFERQEGDEGHYRMVMIKTASGQKDEVKIFSDLKCDLIPHFDSKATRCQTDQSEDLVNNFIFYPRKGGFDLLSESHDEVGKVRNKSLTRGFQCKESEIQGVAIPSKSDNQEQDEPEVQETQVQDQESSVETKSEKPKTASSVRRPISDEEAQLEKGRQLLEQRWDEAEKRAADSCGSQ